MIPRCVGCQCELDAAYEYQQKGADIAVEGMNKKGHCFFLFVDDEEEKP